MNREIIVTRDGSTSIAIPELQVTYHSLHGALQESIHVFIEAGLKQFSTIQDRPVRILEMGFGTGLNALLTLINSNQTKQTISYTTIEKFPLEIGEVESLNYCELLKVPELQQDFIRLHTCDWNNVTPFSQQFSFKKIEGDLEIVTLESNFDLIYYDAFAPSAQPDLWIEPVFLKLFNACAPGGILVTYCSKSSVQRAMKAAGWKIEKIPGPWGKREMVRARKGEGER